MHYGKPDFLFRVHKYIHTFCIFFSFRFVRSYPDAVAVGNGDDLPFQRRVVFEHRPGDVGHRPEGGRYGGGGREAVDPHCQIQPQKKINPRKANSKKDKDERGTSRRTQRVGAELEWKGHHRANSRGIGRVGAVGDS